MSSPGVSAPVPVTVPPPATGPAPAAGVALVIDGRVHIPAGITDLASFRRWWLSDAFPKRGRFGFLGGVLWVDLTLEQLYTHNQVKAAFTVGVMGLLQTNPLGRFVPDGMNLSNVAANLATVPDGAFFSYAALQSGRIRQVPGAHTGFVELEGTPDMMLEVVSESSVEKDNTVLRDLYWRADIPEYWLVDARGADVRFDILRHRPGGYEPVAPDVGGWLRSEVFARSFRLTRGADPLGQPTYTLEVRD